MVWRSIQWIEFNRDWQIFQQLMSLHKTATVELPNPAWGQLVPLPGQPLATFPLSNEETIIGRNPDCTIQILDKRLSGKHCSLTLKGDSIVVTDLSTNGTFVEDAKVGKGVERPIKHGDSLWLLPAGKVPINQALGFKIVKHSESKRIEEEKKKADEEAKKMEEVKKAEEAKKKSEEEAKNKGNSSFAQSIKEQITCSFCYEIMCVPVSVQPCNHRFCGGCLSELVNSKKDACIQCRKPITTAARDAGFSSIIEDYLKNNPSEKRDPAEEEDNKKKNIFGHEPLNVQEKIHGKPKAPVKPPVKVASRRGRALVRASSDLSASDGSEEKCRQCTIERKGFKCGPSQVHTKCHTCGKLIAQRDAPDIHQCCALCTTYFCNLYFPPCAKTGNKLQLLISRKESTRIDADLLRGNAYQFQTLRKYLLDRKWSSRDVFDHMMERIGKRKYSYLFDRKIMKVPPVVSKEVVLERDSAVCDQCWRDLWFQMVVSFRIEISAEMPAAVRDRPICYWGINCRTMEHNADHARKYSHCIYQSRF